MRQEFVCTFEKSLIGAERDAELLSYHLSAALEQLNLLFAQPQTHSEGNHFILLLKEQPLNAGKVNFVARLCDCWRNEWGCDCFMA